MVPLTAEAQGRDGYGVIDMFCVDEGTDQTALRTLGSLGPDTNYGASDSRGGGVTDASN